VLFFLVFASIAVGKKMILASIKGNLQMNHCTVSPVLA